MADMTPSEREAMHDDEYAVPGKRKLPIHDAEHVRMAWDMVDRTKGLTAAERAAARRRILEAAHTHGVDTSAWSKQEMTDTVVTPLEVVTDASGSPNDPLKVRFRATRTNVRNANNRVYPDAVMEDAVERANASYVRTGRMIGESPHPKAIQAANGKTVFDTRLENSVIKITNLFKDGNEVFCDAEVLDTAKGRDLAGLIRQQAWPGISMRALGESVRREVECVMVDVATFLDIQSFDVVMNPATDGCGALAVLTDSEIEAMLDMHVSCCPKCGDVLTENDPDNDGDVDFLTCECCGDAYLQRKDATVQSQYQHTLQKVPREDWDGYGLAREWLAEHPINKEMTAPVKEGEIVKTEDLINAMKNDPTVRAAVAELAGQIAKPALDAVEAQKDAEARAQAKAEAAAYVTERLASLEANFDAETLSALRDSVGTPDNRELARVVLDSSLKVLSATRSKGFLDSVGFDTSRPQPAAQVRVEVGEGPKPWRPVVDAICKEMDGYAEQLGHTHDNKLRDYNRKNIIDKVLPHAESIVGHRVLADSVQNGRLRLMTDSGAQLLSDAVSVTTQQLLNQPTILTAVIVQAFQDVESAQFMFTDVFRGSEWRQPIETFSSAATLNPATGLMDLAVAEGNGISASAINLGWQSFSPTWRRNAVSLSTDVIRQLESGPVNYAAIARAIYHISEDKKRKLDNAAYLEMVMASDEYAPLVVANEAPAKAAVVKTGLPAGTNATYLYKLSPATSNPLAGYNPVVRPRSVNQIQPNGQIQAFRPTRSLPSWTTATAPAPRSLGRGTGGNRWNCGDRVDGRIHPSTHREVVRRHARSEYLRPRR